MDNNTFIILYREEQQFRIFLNHLFCLKMFEKTDSVIVRVHLGVGNKSIKLPIRSG